MDINDILHGNVPDPDIPPRHVQVAALRSEIAACARRLARPVVVGGKTWVLAPRVNPGVMVVTEVIVDGRKFRLLHPATPALEAVPKWDREGAMRQAAEWNRRFDDPALKVEPRHLTDIWRAIIDRNNRAIAALEVPTDEEEEEAK